MTSRERMFTAGVASALMWTRARCRPPRLNPASGADARGETVSGGPRGPVRRQVRLAAGRDTGGRTRPVPMTPCSCRCSSAWVSWNHRRSRAPGCGEGRTGRRYSLTDKGRRYYPRKKRITSGCARPAGVEHDKDLCVARLSLDKVVKWSPPSRCTGIPRPWCVTRTMSSPWTGWRTRRRARSFRWWIGLSATRGQYADERDRGTTGRQVAAGAAGAVALISSPTQSRPSLLPAKKNNAAAIK